MRLTGMMLVVFLMYVEQKHYSPEQRKKHVRILSRKNFMSVEDRIHISFFLFPGGPFDRIQTVLRLERPGQPGTIRRAVIFGIITWLPLVMLASLQNLALGAEPKQSLLLDFFSYVRFLLAVPLLILGETFCSKQLALVVRQFVLTGVVRNADLPSFNRNVKSLLRHIDSSIVELVLVIIAYTGAISSVMASLSLGNETWVVREFHGGYELSLAGWWYVAVSLPLYYFIATRWLWRIFLWARFLLQVARMNIRVIPAHPDLAGGLAFVGDSPAAFTLPVFAYGCVLAGRLANEVVYAGKELLSFKFIILAFLLLELLLFAGPIIVFAGPLGRAKRKGLLQYEGLASIMAQQFEKKWMEEAAADKEGALGQPDFSSLADLNQCVALTRRMNPVPFKLMGVVPLILAALVPLIPVVAIEIPLDDVLKALLKALF